MQIRKPSVAITTSVLVFFGISLFAQQQKAIPPVSERLAAQNALFDEIWETGLRHAPERATAVGDYRYNDKLSHASLAEIVERNKEDRAFLARLKAISTDGFPDQDALSHELLQRSFEQRNIAFELKNYEMPVSQFNGIHTGLANLPLAVPLDSVKHYEDYIARLHQMPRALNQTIEVMRVGMKDNLMPVRFLLEAVAVQCQGIID